jgi:RNA 2',3'-cyclic 3'-phosphodiesterase
MKRLFAAIKIHPSESFVSLMYLWKHALRNENIKWVETTNIHITLKFFGETEESRIAEIIEGLNMVATKHKPFKFYIKGAGVFGSSYDPRVIWFGIKENKELQNLSTDVLNSMEMIGWAKDRQNIIPHLTMGRIKHVDDKTKLKELVSKNREVDIQEESLNEFYLYESILKPQGPIYNILETLKLK